MRVRLVVPIVDLRPFLPDARVRYVQNMAKSLAATSRAPFWPATGQVVERGVALVGLESTGNFVVPFSSAIVVPPEELNRVAAEGLRFEFLAAHFCQDSPKVLHTRMELVLRIAKPGLSITECMQLLGGMKMTAKALRHEAPVSRLETLARGQYLHATTNGCRPGAIGDSIRDGGFEAFETLVAARRPTVICELGVHESGLVSAVPGAVRWGADCGVDVYRVPFGFASGWLLIDNGAEPGALGRMQAAIARMEGAAFSITYLKDRLEQRVIQVCQPPNAIATRKELVERVRLALTTETQFGLETKHLRDALRDAVGDWTAVQDAHAVMHDLDACRPSLRRLWSRVASAALVLVLAAAAWSYFGREVSPRPPSARAATPAHLAYALPPAATNNLWLREPADGSDTVFVFVHGIFSDSRNCWWYVDDEEVEADCYWPHMVTEDGRLDAPSIFLGGFYTDVLSSAYGIEDCSDELMRALRTPDAVHSTAPLSKDNILFIGHSTGGIVIRHMLDEHYESFVGKNIGVLLIASPSLGSEWADRLEWLIKASDNKLASQLRWNSDALVGLDNRFKRLVYDRKIPGLVGAEAYENRFILWRGISVLVDRIVERESASRYFGPPTQLADTNHFSCVKPNSKSHPAHSFLVDFYLKQFKPGLR